MLRFSDINKLMSHLEEEKSAGERFATRFILVQGCDAWRELVDWLSCEVEITVNLSQFCSGKDVFPNMHSLQSYLEKEVAGSRTIMILPLAECIRLDPESTEIVGYLAQWDSNLINRIYVPLLAAEDFFYQAIHKVLRFRTGELPEVWWLEGEGSSEVIVAPFKPNLSQQKIVEGIKEYLTLWEQSSIDKAWLVTEMAAYLPEQQSRSECRVKLYPSSYSYVRLTTRWDGLYESWGTPEQWDWLASQISDASSFDDLAGKILNVSNYDAEQLFALWDKLDKFKQWLIWVWSKKQSNLSSYLHEVLMTNNSFECFVYDVSMGIFDIPLSLELIRQRKNLLQSLGITHMPREFWEKFNQLKDPFHRLSTLTDLSFDQRKRVVECVAQLIETEDLANEWWSCLEVVFPELAWYLESDMTDDKFVNTYFRAYNRCRVADQVNEELDCLVHKWASGHKLWSYQGRSDVLNKERAKGATILWVDAMGIEWVGLLTHLLMEKYELDCEVKVTRANLPTVTDANREWEENEEVIRGLDDIAHHYSYEFPDSFLKAFDEIKNIAQKVSGMLSHSSYVVITSDHGLSRFSAISKNKVALPDGAKVEGRYAEVPEIYDHMQGDELWVAKDGAVYLTTHKKFSGWRGVPGEVHGGATPEESLTPIIIVRRNGLGAQLSFEVLTNPVKLSARGEGVLKVSCNRKVENVKLKIFGYTFQGISEAALAWSFNIKNLNAGSYSGRIYCGGQNQAISFEVIKGIIQENLGL